MEYNIIDANSIEVRDKDRRPDVDDPLWFDGVEVVHLRGEPSLSLVQRTFPISAQQAVTSVDFVTPSGSQAIPKIPSVSTRHNCINSTFFRGLHYFLLHELSRNSLPPFLSFFHKSHPQCGISSRTNRTRSHVYYHKNFYFMFYF